MEPINPWSDIWFKPRQTIRHIVETNPYRSVLLLALLGSVGQTLGVFSAQGIGKILSMGEILVTTILTAPLVAFFYLFALGWLLHQVALRLGGEGSIEQTRAALAWSWAPIVSVLPLWGVKYILFRDELFLADKPFVESQPVLSFLAWVIGVVDFAIGLWSLIILFSALSEIHRISVLKSIGAFLLTQLIVAVPALLIMTLCSPM